jgi:WD40 repeat protein/class 3 adenylate cyclase
MPNAKGLTIPIQNRSGVSPGWVIILLLLHPYGFDRVILRLTGSTMSRSLRVSQTSIDTAKLAVRRSGFSSQRALSEDVGLSLATVSNFLRGKPVDRATFLELCDRLSLDPAEICSLRPDPDRAAPQRLLAAIAFTDVVSFTQRMATNERHALALVHRDLQLMEIISQQFSGRLLKRLGDGLMLYFKSAEQAVLCAISMQQTLADSAAQLSPDDVLQHRIGIDLGDVVCSDDDVMGNSVNLAARLQTAAPPGGICLSQAIYTVVKPHLPFPAKEAGNQVFKGLSEPLRIYHLTLPSRSTGFSPAPLGRPQTLDWGDAMDSSVFYGRTGELSTLSDWILQDGCRLITLIGMGGMGKTALAIKLVEQIQSEYQAVIWRSLRHAPPLQELLVELLGLLDHQSNAMTLSQTVGNRITQLITHLRQHRCLLVLDNVESILCTGDRAGAYREGYEAYGQLFQSVGESRHQSCFVLTSRELPGGLAAKASRTSPIRALRLAGLDPNNARGILQDKGLAPHAAELGSLIEHYAGNPLALKIVATTIQDLFSGDIARFLQQGTTVFGDIAELLAHQFARLTAIEQQVMVWLTIAREGVSFSDLQQDMLPPPAPQALLDALGSLQQRCLIETASPKQAPPPRAIPQDPTTLFTQQPVVMEYVTHRLIDQVCGELCRNQTDLIHRYALSQAQTEDYIRNSQLRLIVRPILAQLQNQLGSPDAVQACLDRNLSALKARPTQSIGYGAGNLLKLLHDLGVDLQGYDFSGLAVWQVDLQGVELPQVKLTGTDLSRSVFTQTLGDILSIAFSPDGSQLAVGIDHQLMLWRIADRCQIATFTGGPAWVRCLAFSPDGKWLAGGRTDHTIDLWDLSTGERLATLCGHQGGIQSLAFCSLLPVSAGSPRLLLVSGSTDHTMRCWDVQTQQCVKTLEGHRDRILSVMVAPDQNTLISTSDDETIRVWDVASGHCRQTINTHVNWMLSAALSPDGAMLATGSDQRTVTFWQVGTGACLGSLPDYTATVWSVAFSPNGQLLATGSDDHTVRLWDMQTRQCVRTWQDHTQQVWQVSFSPDGRSLVSGSEDQTIKLWDVNTGHCLTTITGHQNWVGAIAFSPDDRTLASGSKDHKIRLWDLETGRCIKAQKGHSDVVTAVAFCPRATPLLLVTGSDDHTVKLWNARTLDCVQTLQGHQGWVPALAFSPKGQTLASGSNDKTIKLWRGDSWECIYTLKGHRQRVQSVAFHPQGERVASGSDDHTIKIWQVSTGRCLQTLNDHASGVLAVDFSPEGTLLASGSRDRTIKIWDVKTGTCQRTLTGHSHRVRSVAFSPDGNFLASGSEDCSIKVWQVSSGQCLRTLRGHEQIIWMVTFSHRGDRIASCSDDGTIRIWDMNTGENLKFLQPERPYEGMNITGAVGLTPAQKVTLRALGAISE